MGARHRRPDAELSGFDLRTMLQGYFGRGFASTSNQVDIVTKLLGHTPRSYDDFASETAGLWT
jgi:hypothetical protein